MGKRLGHPEVWDRVMGLFWPYSYYDTSYSVWILSKFSLEGLNQ